MYRASALPEIDGCDSFSNTIVTSLLCCVPVKAGGGGGVVSVVQVYDVPSLTLPAASRALTVNVCDVGQRAAGERAGALRADAVDHALVVDASRESVNEKVPMVELVTAAGWSVITGAGGGVPVMTVPPS